MDESKQKNCLSTDDVCRIIKACGEAKVAVLKFGDLCVKFEATPAPNPWTPTQSPDSGFRAPRSVDTAHSSTSAAEIAGTHEQVAEESLLQDEAAVREEQIAQMVIENPLLAEQLLMDGVLTDEEEPADEETY
jgi:hypothetical protein